MSAAPLGERQVFDRVKAIVRRRPEARRIGLRAAPRWTPQWDENEHHVMPSPAGGELRLRVAPCRSTLELRERLIEAERGDEDVVWVFLADLPPTELGADVEARLFKGRLLEESPWAPVLRRLRTRSLDPRLARRTWMAELLLDFDMPTGVPAAWTPAAQGVLGEAAARRAVLEHALALDAEPLADELLRWAVSDGAQERWNAAPAPLHEAFSEWLEPSTGAAVDIVRRLLDHGRGADVVALARVARLLRAKKGRRGAGEASWVRLQERFFGGDEPPKLALESWIDAARAEEVDPTRVDALLAELRVPEKLRAQEEPPTQEDDALDEAAATSEPAQLSLLSDTLLSDTLLSDAPWIDQLLECEIYRQQKEQAGRKALKDERLRALLRALDRRHGVATLAALERELESSRVPGWITPAQNLLNVDQYTVLEMEGSTVRLDQKLLLKQFELAPSSGDAPSGDTPSGDIPSGDIP